MQKNLMPLTNISLSYRKEKNKMKKSDKEIEDIIDHQMKLVADEMVKEITNSDE